MTERHRGDQAAVPTVTAQPILMARIGWSLAVFVVIVFTIVAIVMPHANSGATFGPKDQVATGLLGIVIGLGFWLLTRPRLVADTTSIRTRSFAGDFRTIPWDVIEGIEFPRKAQFARLVLPGGETLALYAVQRIDPDYAVDKMHELRALLAVVRGAAPEAQRH